MKRGKKMSGVSALCFAELEESDLQGSKTDPSFLQSKKI